MLVVLFSLSAFTYSERPTLVTRWMSLGFLFGCKYMTIFSKGFKKLMKIKENEMQTFALLRKVCGSTISGGGS